MFGKATAYFDEVARRGSIRQASEHLRIAPSAIDRQILKLEAELGAPLFERLPRGLRLTAAGELLLESVRRWRRDTDRLQSQIDDLQGLRRGEVTIALVEGASHLLAHSLKSFQTRYPAVAYRLQVAGAHVVSDLILSGACELGLTFNPPAVHALRIERTLVYRLGVVVRPDHPLTQNQQVRLIDCQDCPVIVPDDSLSLRAVIDQLWAKSVGEVQRFSITASSIELIKTLVRKGLGVGLLTAADAVDDIRSGELVFLPLADEHARPSVLSLISGWSRTLSAPAALLLQHLSADMLNEPAP